MDSFYLIYTQMLLHIKYLGHALSRARRFNSEEVILATKVLLFLFLLQQVNLHAQLKYQFFHPDSYPRNQPYGKTMLILVLLILVWLRFNLKAIK